MTNSTTPETTEARGAATGLCEIAECPSCGKAFQVDVSAMLPEQTDLTLSIKITAGQLVMAKTVAGVIENFAALQVEVGKSLGISTAVFIAGLRYEDDTIYITFRVANEIAGEVSPNAARATPAVPMRGEG